MKRRDGFMMLELAISIVLVGTLLAIALQVLSWTARERRACDRRSVALLECGNVLDRLTRLPWDELTSDRVAAVKMSDETAAILPDGKLKVTLKQPDAADGKRVSVSIDWLGDHQVREGPVRLTAWVFK